MLGCGVQLLACYCSSNHYIAQPPLHGRAAQPPTRAACPCTALVLPAAGCCTAWSTWRTTWRAGWERSWRGMATTTTCSLCVECGRVGWSVQWGSGFRVQGPPGGTCGQQTCSQRAAGQPASHRPRRPCRARAPPPRRTAPARLSCTATCLCSAPLSTTSSATAGRSAWCAALRCARRVLCSMCAALRCAVCCVLRSAACAAVCMQVCESMLLGWAANPPDPPPPRHDLPNRSTAWTASLLARRPSLWRGACRR